MSSGPSDLAQVFIDAGIPRRKPPANAACINAGVVEGRGPGITSPDARQRLHASPHPA